jgi:putative serine protease PepD
MTPGYDAADPASRGAIQPDPLDYDVAEHRGPRPPRIDPPASERTAAHRAVSTFGDPRERPPHVRERPDDGRPPFGDGRGADGPPFGDGRGAPDGPPFGDRPLSAGQVPAGQAYRLASSPPTSSFSTSSFPGAVPVTSPGPAPGFGPGQVSGGPDIGYAPDGFGGAPLSGGPAGAVLPGGPSGPPFATVPARPRRGLTGPIALVLVVLLLFVTAVQAYMLMDTRRRLDAAQRKTDTVRAAAEERAAALEQRTIELERQAVNNLDAEAVASGVLPSVFRVSTSAGLGTGFAFGNETSDGGTYLLTNFHVVEAVYNRGVRTVALEQQNRRWTANVVKVDPEADLALLQVPDKFPRLQPAAEAAKPGQPVVVVGAPLGLSDTVTSGVVSALRTVGGRPVLQFDASVNPGNSGGPVVNAQKQVVGVVNAKLNNAEGISLGIPVAVACQTFSLC